MSRFKIILITIIFLSGLASAGIVREINKDWILAGENDQIEVTLIGVGQEIVTYYEEIPQSLVITKKEYSGNLWPAEPTYIGVYNIHVNGAQAEGKAVIRGYYKETSGSNYSIPGETTIQIRRPTWMKFDTNSDLVISKQEVISVMSTYFMSGITIDEMMSVIEKYFRG